jgi:hypothetical protein
MNSTPPPYQTVHPCTVAENCGFQSIPDRAPGHIGARSGNRLKPAEIRHGARVHALKGGYRGNVAKTALGATMTVNADDAVKQ